MKNDPIFVITTVRMSLDGQSRSVGFFHEFYLAANEVINNSGDINENGYYPYAVIEKTYPGIYTLPREEFWYKWNHEKGLYELIPEKPDRFKNVCGWGLG